jgi:hypothetical protein
VIGFLAEDIAFPRSLVMARAIIAEKSTATWARKVLLERVD